MEEFFHSAPSKVVSDAANVSWTVFAALPFRRVQWCDLPSRCVNSTPHTSHFLVFHSTHFNVTLTLAQEQGVWRALHTCVIFMRSCCVLLDFLRLSLLLFAFHLLSHLPFHSPDHLLLPRGRQEPCALLRMRTLAPLRERSSHRL